MKAVTGSIRRAEPKSTGAATPQETGGRRIVRDQPVLDSLVFRQPGAHPLQQRPARIGQAHRTGGALQQARLHALLQRGDLLGRRAGGQRVTLGSAGEALQLGNGLKQAQGIDTVHGNFRYGISKRILRPLAKCTRQVIRSV